MKRKHNKTEKEVRKKNNSYLELRRRKGKETAGKRNCRKKKLQEKGAAGKRNCRKKELQEKGVAGKRGKSKENI